MSKDIDLSSPQFDQSTYLGRAKHFFLVTNPLNLLASDKELDEAKSTVDEFKKTKKMPHGYNEAKLWRAKYLCDSSFHPDTGEKMILVGRMAAQAPVNTFIGGGMITFYRTKPALIFWQWMNQTFNALVNYSNRSGTANITTQQVALSYCAACGGALGTAVYLNNLASKSSNPLFVRLVPFVAVCAANCINIPMMRSHELFNGTPIFTVPEGKLVGESKVAAQTGIMLVCLSRIFMAIPGMTITPALANYATMRGLFCHSPKMVIPFQIILMALSVSIATPLGCALFNQRATLDVNSLEPALKEQMKKSFPKTSEVFYNKGL